MSEQIRVAVFGGDELRASITALGFVPVDEDARIAVIDTNDPQALVRAAALPPEVPRALLGPAAHRALVAATGLPARFADSAEPAVLGPLLLSLVPPRPRARTRIVVVTGVRGGVGRTLLATNLARRLARHTRAVFVDATGSGAAAWWLRCEAASWSTLEGLVDEMSPDHLAVVAHDAGPQLRLVGGPFVAPSEAILLATVRAAATTDDIVVVDAPPAWHRENGSLRSIADRWLVLSYDDGSSAAALRAAAPTDDDWVIASQSRAQRIGDVPTFRTLPRDERAVATALDRRGAVGGALGRAYDDLAELVAIDAS
ncbi:MAG TPA: hypothetical protein VFV20_07600 [Candidatus Limnocylindria bacterium]|nr:hypothetical protein [Candidatus Limnocylindria bacterium]